MNRFHKSTDQIELEALQDAATRSTSSKAHAQAEIERQVQEFFRNGGTIQAVTGMANPSGTFNRAISDRSGVIAENFGKREKTPRAKVLKAVD